jgi:HlyD family secretion protein
MGPRGNVTATVPATTSPSTDTAPARGLSQGSQRSQVSQRSPRSPRLRLLAIAAVAALAYGGYRVWDGRRPYEWSGTVEARTIAVGSRVGGRIKTVRASEGQRIAAGEPLLVLEAGDLDAQRLMAQGQLEEAQANLDKLVRGARPEEIDEAKAHAQTAVAALEETKTGARSEEIAEATARLSAAQVTADKAKLDDDRARKLVATGAIAQSQLDDADTALKGAVAQRDAAVQVLDELKNGSRREDIAQAQARASEARASAKLVLAGSRVEDIKAGQGQVDAAKGKLDQIGTMLDELTIRAPVAARVEALDLRPGDILAPNSTAATLLEDTQLYVRIYVPETQIGHIQLDQEVPISVDSFPSRTFRGVVEHINGVGEYSPRNLQTADERANQVFAARIGLREGSGELRAGMAAFIHVPR